MSVLVPSPRLPHVHRCRGLRLTCEWTAARTVAVTWNDVRGRRGRMRCSALAAVAVVAAVCAVAAGSARAQVAATPASSLTTNYRVDALAAGPGNVLYAGGSFDWLAMPTGHLAWFDASGARDAAWPDVDGLIFAAVADGAGGWYVSGDFSHVGGRRRANLAHIEAGGALDPLWAPAAKGAVHALSVVGDTLYLGGLFKAIDGQPRGGLAAVDTRSGRLRAWAPDSDQAVYALAAASGTIYAGGGGYHEPYLGAFDAESGAPTSWHPTLTRCDTTENHVSSMTVARGRLYVGGLFCTIDGRDRACIAAFDTATGALTSWNPAGYDRTWGAVDAIEVTGDTVYLGGSFDRMGGAARARLAAVDARTGRALPWRADARGGDERVVGDVQALAVAGDRLYVGGNFTSLAGRRRTNLGAVSATTGAPTSFDPPRPSDFVLALVAAEDGVLAGGSFNGFDSRPRTSVAAIDLDTGGVLPFDAHPEGAYGYAEVAAVATQGRSVFTAGDFDRIGGRRRRALAKLDAQTGKAQAFNARVGPVWTTLRALAVHGRRLYVGGTFRRIGGHPRRGLAVLDTRTGRATGWHADADHAVRGLVINGHTLYVTGAFTRLGGHRRRHLAAIDLRSGRVTAWNPNPDRPVRALAFADGRVYLGGRFRHVGGHRRKNLAAVNTSDGKVQLWQPRANAPVHALAIIAGTIYAGGAFTSISGARRKHVAGLDLHNGAPTPWNPGADKPVDRLLATPAGLIAAGGFESLAGTTHQGLGIFPPTTDDPRRQAATRHGELRLRASALRLIRQHAAPASHATRPRHAERPGLAQPRRWECVISPWLTGALCEGKAPSSDASRLG